MARIIKGEEVQKGDKIRVVLEFTVANTTFNEDSEIRSQEHGEWFDIPEEAVIELVERPLPELPTAKGSVVKVSNSSRSANWFLRQDHHWHSEDSSKKSAEEFARFVVNNNFDLEVIA